MPATSPVKRAGSRARSAVADPRLVSLLVYTVLALLLFRRAWTAATTHNVGDSGDPSQTMWMLRWTPYALSHGRNLLITDHLNFPFGVNLMWNSPVVLPALVLCPITSIFGPIAAYNTFMTLNLAGSAWCAYLMCRRFVRNNIAAFAGGLLYGFSPYMMAHSRGHPTLTALFVPPLVVICLHELFDNDTRRPWVVGCGLGILAACQLFIAEEVLAGIALCVGIGLVVLALLHPQAVKVHLRRLAAAGSVAVGVFLLLTAWALIVQFLGDQRLTNGTVHPPGRFVSDLLNFVVPTKAQALSPSSAADLSERWTGNISEQNAYLGIPLLAITIVLAQRMWRNHIVRAAVIIAAAIAVLSMGPSLHVGGNVTRISLPWRAVGALPLIGNLLPSRLMAYAFLAVGLMLAVGIERLLSMRPWPTLLRVACGAGALGLAVTLIPDLQYPASRIANPHFFTDGARIIPDGSVALIAPIQQILPVDPMLWQASSDMRFRMPQGYFYVPDSKGKPSFGAPLSELTVMMHTVQAGQDPDLNPESIARVAADLDLRRVDTVVVGPMRYQDRMLAFFELLLGRPPTVVDDVYVWQNPRQLIRDRVLGEP